MIIIINLLYLLLVVTSIVMLALVVGLKDNIIGNGYTMVEIKPTSNRTIV